MEDELQKALSHPCAQICETNWIDQSGEAARTLCLLLHMKNRRMVKPIEGNGIESR